MTKVCMITQDCPYIDRRILFQADSLVRAGYDVSVVYPFGDVSGDFDDAGIRYLPAVREKKMKNALTRLKKAVRSSVPPPLYRGLKACYLALGDVSAIDYETELLRCAAGERFDIYVAHDLPALPVAYEVARRHGAKLVYDAHEFFLGQTALRGRRKAFFETLERRLIGEADLMFTVNGDIARLFEKAYGREGIRIVMNAVRRVRIEKRDLHGMLGLERGTKIVLYQGGFLEDRNLERLVRASRHFAEGTVLLMLGYSFLEKRLKEIAAANGTLGKKVFFMERVPHRELLHYTAAADLGVIPYPAVDPNTKYCTPNKLFEFVTAGLPVVANRELKTVSDMIGRYGIGETIAFDDPADIARDIGRAVKRVAAAVPGENLKRAAVELGWERQESVLLNAYAALGK